MTARRCVLAAALALAIAVARGAFGAHALRGRLAPDALGIFQTGVQYHFWNALGLLSVGILMTQWTSTRLLAIAAWLLIAGLLLFSGSLYVLAVTGERWVGALTPLGGGAFIAAWLMVAWAALR